MFLGENITLRPLGVDFNYKSEVISSWNKNFDFRMINPEILVSKQMIPDLLLSGIKSITFRYCQGNKSFTVTL